MVSVSHLRLETSVLINSSLQQPGWPDGSPFLYSVSITLSMKSLLSGIKILIFDINTKC